MIKRVWLGLIILGGLSACAENYQHTVVREAVSSRVFLDTPAAPNDAELSVVRENGLFGGGCSTQIVIDGVPAAQLQQGERVSFHLAPGVHQLQARSFGSCSWQLQRQDIVLTAGGHLKFAIGSHGTSFVPRVLART